MLTLALVLVLTLLLTQYLLHVVLFVLDDYAIVAVVAVAVVVFLLPMPKPTLVGGGVGLWVGSVPIGIPLRYHIIPIRLCINRRCGRNLDLRQVIKDNAM